MASNANKEKRLPILILCNIHEHAVVENLLESLPLSVQSDVRQRFDVEWRKPGAGVLTMDFCTLGMFILGMYKLIRCSLPIELMVGR